MRARGLIRCGVPRGNAIEIAKATLAGAARSEPDPAELPVLISRVVELPESSLSEALWGELARAILDHRAAQSRYESRPEPASYETWGADLDAESVRQMEQACQLPIALRGALMPDAHVGYGLPIGGALATRDAVIPYAVGVDIAYRMKMSVLDMPPGALEDQRGLLTTALEQQTSFGVRATFRRRRDRHPLLHAGPGEAPGASC